jgi:hypothetical protein
MTRLYRHVFTFSICIVAMLASARPSCAIDFYEIQIYDTDTAPVRHLTLELHSNTTSTATGQVAKSQMDVHQIHETLEATYGVLRWLEIGQYFATAKLSNGDYEYSGSRTKVISVSRRLSSGRFSSAVISSSIICGSRLRKIR